MKLRRPQNKTPFWVSVLLIAVGAGFVAGAIAVATLLGRAEIELSKTPGGVEGELRWAIWGMPIYWRSLHGLATVERDDYEVRDDRNRSKSRSSRRSTKNVARLTFLDANGKELAWAERTKLINEREPIQRFLDAPSYATSAASGPVTYIFKEPASTRVWDQVKAITIVLLTVPFLALGGLLFLLSGILSLAFRILGLAENGTVAPSAPPLLRADPASR